ncbi:prolipoprotein diacylglyceryl transferase [Candidatus Sumerlaeota bacterium]|nr:prolipoprotein diacylglyceryl transferase [Candidatus Sumerlaeota bacterium]
MDAQSYYLHRISPYIVRFGGGFGLRWYGVSYVAGFIVGLLLLRHLSKAGFLKIKFNEIDALLTYLIIGVVAGGRIGYVLFYEPALLWDWGSGFPYWGLLAINKGGMSSHGGFLALIFMGVLFARKYGYPLLHIGDAVVIAAPPGLFFGRMANFINGELFGRPSTVPWAVCFPTEIMNWPSEKIQTLFHHLNENGMAFRDVNHLIESIPGNDAAASLVSPFLIPRHPSQIYEALLEGVALFAILWIARKKIKRDGMMIALFFWGYAVMRIFAEQFREPDAGIGYQWLGLTRGQWLSMGMLAAGGIFYYLSFMGETVLKKNLEKKSQDKAHKNVKRKISNEK